MAARNRRAAAIVEFAIVLPIVLLCFASMIEISRILLLQNSADTAAYEGARCAMVPGANTTEAIESAKRLLQAAGLKKCEITVAPDLITEETELILVNVEVPVAPNAWITPFWFMPNSVVSQVALVCERPAVVKLTAVPKLKEIKSALKKGKKPKDILDIAAKKKTGVSSAASVSLATPTPATPSSSSTSQSKPVVPNL